VLGNFFWSVFTTEQELSSTAVPHRPYHSPGEQLSFNKQLILDTTTTTTTTTKSTTILWLPGPCPGQPGEPVPEGTFHHLTGISGAK